MNVNDILRKLLQCTEGEILTILKSGIARYAALSILEEQAVLLSKRKRERRCISVTLFPKLSSKPSDYSISEKLSSYPQDQSLFEINNLIESVYKKVVAKYKGTSWVRGEGKVEIHIAAVKQFWLDCYVADANFLSLLQSSLPNKVWVNFAGFKKSVESTRGVSAFAIFSIKRYDKKLQKIFQTQKMVCKLYIVFFCFVQIELGMLMIRQNLAKVLALVNIREKTQINIWADQLISGANKLAGSGKDYISFKEFFHFITS